MNSEQTFTETDIARFIKQIILGMGSIGRGLTSTETPSPGLQHLHSHNVVHLDVKPENIVCQNLQAFNIKLVDFGLSRRLAEDRDICVMQRTPDFVSPEVTTPLLLSKTVQLCVQVISYSPIGVEADMWSLGVITYVLLSGNQYFLM